MSSVVVVAVYKFATLENLPELREELISVAKENGILGTILVAPEGINTTFAGSELGSNAFLDHLRKIPGLADLDPKFSSCEKIPFLRLKVRLKKEIVTLRAPEANPAQSVGTYVKPADWDDLIADPNVIVVDTRNDYEVQMGTFRGALNPGTEFFGDFPEWVDGNLDPNTHQRVAMFCTGGIRCEKATALLLNRGFKDVYHLQGGILKYLEEIPSDQSSFEGECFVFDDREALRHGLEAKVPAPSRKLGR